MANAGGSAANINTFWDKLGLIPASLTEGRRVIEAGIETGDCTCLIGEAGIGKTQLMSQIADDLDMDCVFFYLAHVEREDISGIPFPTEDGKSYKFLCEESILKVVENKRDTLLCFDELNRGEKPVMSAMFTTIESRRFGSTILPPRVHLTACMNPSEGMYLVNEFEQDAAFRRRMCFVAVHATIDTWKAYAAGRGKFHRGVIEFISKNPKLLNDVKSRDAGMIYSNPASLEKLSNLVKAFERKAINFVEDSDLIDIFRLKAAGHIGINAADRFITYLAENATQIDPYEVMFKYKSKAKKSVIRILELGRTDILTELADSVALLLISEEPDTHRVGRHIAGLCEDIPEDPLVTFLGQLRKYAREQNKLGPNGYYAKLNQELNTHQAFMNSIGNLDNAVFKISERSK
jgi:MoxR-like ATPase